MTIHAKPKIALLTATVLAGFLPVSTYAAEAETDVGLQEIIVTAQKRSENLQEVPIQVAAFTEGKIADAGITATRDFVAMVPNMSLDESFTYLNSFVVVRGVTQINNADSPVAVVVDGVAQNNQKQLKMNLFDIERIEVLKGPQGALYGRNAIGGAINIVTKAPSNDFEGSLFGSYGKGDVIDLNAAVSGPIVADKLLFRVAASHHEDNGRITNTYLDKKVDTVGHDDSIRGRLLFNASEAVTFDLRGSYTDFRAGGVYDSVVFSGDANDYVAPRTSLLGTTWGSIGELTLKADADLGVATLTSISGYTRLKENYRGDLDFSNTTDKPGGFLGLGIQVGQGQNLDVEMFSQELRLTSPDNQPLRWIAGAYFIHTNRSLFTRAFVDLDGTLAQFDNDALAIVNLSEDNSNNAYALFGQVDFDITDQLTLSGALRYDSDKREQTNVLTSLTRDKTFSSLQPKVTLTYKPTDEQMLYATYSTGFRSGGFNAPTVSIPVFDDETLQNFEGGFKTSWLDRRLILNGAIYYSKVDDFQFFFVDALSASQIIANIDKVDIWGIELEAQALLAEGVEFNVGLGTTDSDIKKITVFPGNEGNKTPKSTTWSLTAGLQIRREITEGLNGFARIDYDHKGKKYWQVDNADAQKPVDIFNARIGVDTDSWGVYLWGKNLTNEKYYSDFNPREFSGTDVDLGFRGQPRSYGIEARYKF